MPESIESLQSRFGIPGAVQFEPGQGTLPQAVITTPHATAQVYLHGGHVTAYQPTGQKPLLFLSSKSHFEPNKPIRGGVPICFPWFGPRKDDPSSPAHGFARLKSWTVQSSAKADDGSVRLALMLESDEATRTTWPHEFRAVYTVTVGRELRLSLEVHNTGSQPFTFEEALHSYLAVGDVRKAKVEGLEGVHYLDKVQPGIITQASAITFTGETDRVYLNTRSTCVAHDPTGGRNIAVAKDGSNTTVVWNPWIAKAKAMADFGDEEWPMMLCIETANVGESAVTLQAGVSQTMTAVIESRKR